MSFVPDRAVSPYDNFDRLKIALDGINAPVNLSGSSLGTGRDGQIAYYTADDTNGVVWTFRYRSGSSADSKWEFVGGPPLRAEVITTQSTTSTTYTNLSTTGPSITLPLSGDYDIRIGALITHPTSAAYSGLMSFAIGTGTASDNDSAQSISSGLSDGASVYAERRKTGLSAADAVVCKYRTQIAADTATFAVRFICITPVRVT